MKLLHRKQFLHLAAATAALPAASRVARGQTYPSRPVRIIAPVTPGGTTDIIARLIGQWLSERLGQRFIIENRAGAGNNIGTEAVVRAPADGFTLLLTASPNAINATLYDKLNFNYLRDIAPVAGLIRFPYVVEVNPSVPARTISEFIAYAKSNPGKINMASRRHWNRLPRRRRAVQVHDRHQHGPRALSRRHPCDHGPARWTGPGLFRWSPRFDRANQDRSAARARGDDRDAFGVPAGRTDRG
jgi:hypothetical protein